MMAADPFDLRFDGRTLTVVVVLDAWRPADALESGVIVHLACRGPLERMAFGTSSPASDGERRELGEMLVNYGVTERAATCIRHKFIINTDEDGEEVAIRIRKALLPHGYSAMLIVGEADPGETAKIWAQARKMAEQNGITP